MTPFSVASERFAEFGVDVESALKALASVPISLHCWQADDVAGTEKAGAELSGGIQATGNYPGKARGIAEVQQDLDKALSLIPGKHRLNLHACYADLKGKKLDRDAYTIEQFQTWVDYAKSRGLGLDFNPTCFSHPLASDGFTLSHKDAAVRKFWINHCIASRKIGAEMGKQLGKPCIVNVWVPDGYKDTPANRKLHRQYLEQSLDAVFAEKIDGKLMRDAVESKLFGIGVESYTVGSHEFYLGYAVKNQKVLCLDAGHFHPTETLGDKVSSVLQFVPEVLLHTSRGVRWDSDHVVSLDDPTKSLFEEIVRGDFLSRVHIGLDYFDASINRIAAYVIGTRNTLKAVLLALLQPVKRLQELELAGDYTSRLAILEDCKTLPAGLIWDEFCRRNNTPLDGQWLGAVKEYEKAVLSKRS